MLPTGEALLNTPLGNEPSLCHFGFQAAQVLQRRQPEKRDGGGLWVGGGMIVKWQVCRGFRAQWLFCQQDVRMLAARGDDGFAGNG